MILYVLSIICFSSQKNVMSILIMIILNLYVALGYVDILTFLILPIHKHGLSFHLLVLSSVPFFIVL